MFNLATTRSWIMLDGKKVYLDTSPRDLVSEFAQEKDFVNVRVSSLVWGTDRTFSKERITSHGTLW